MDWLVAGRCCVFVGAGAGAGAKGAPVCWFMSMDWRNGLVVCCGAWRPWKAGVAVFWKLATESCGIDERELG